MKSSIKGNKNISILNWFGIIFLLIVPLVFLPQVLDAALMPRLTVFGISLLAFFIFLFYFRKKKNASFQFRNMFDVPVLMLLAFWIIAGLSIFVATNKPEAFSIWLTIPPFIAFVMLGIYVFSIESNPVATISKYIVVFGILHSLIGIAQFINLTSSIGLSHELSYYVKGLSAHRNLYAQVLFLSLPFSLYAILYNRGMWRWLAVLSGFLSLAMVIVLLVKSVWMAMVVSIVLTIVIVLNYYRLFKFDGKSIRKFVVGFLIFVSVIIISVFVYAKLDSWETIDKQADWIRNYRFGSSLERIDLWEKSVDMYRDNYLLGVGTGNWKIALPAYGTGGLRSEEGIIMFIRPHNDFVGVLAENGIFAFILYVGFFLILFYYLYRLMKHDIDKKDKVLLLILFFALISYIVIAMLSFPKERIELSVFLGIYVISIVHLYRKYFPFVKDIDFKYGKLVNYAVIIILLAAIWTGFSKSQSEYHTKKALGFRDDNKYEQVISEIEKAENVLYSVDNTAMPLSWYKASAYYSLGNIDKAFSEYQQSFSYHPNNMHVLNNLATCYEMKGEHEKAIDYFAKAIKISPHFEDALLNMVAVFYAKSDFENALLYLNKVKADSENPKYFISRKLVVNKVLDSVLSELPEGVLKNAVQRIASSEDWAIKVYQQSLNEKKPFKKRILNEAIYLLEVVDSTITPAKASELKVMYL
ncbi:MAG: O-antigen ligase family protein [Bacteroidota bacterium]|nr:O-antigen ligase family protein [Bacteroidota bacterium]